MPTEAQRAQAVALESAATRRAALLTRLSRAFARELARVLRDLERQILVTIPEIRAGSRTALALAARATALRRDLRDALREAGYDDLLVTTAQRSFAALEKLVAETAVGRQVTRFLTTDVGLDKLRALRVLAVTGLEFQGDEIAISLWRTLTQSLYSQRPTREIVQDLADAIDRPEAQARTLYDTATATYTRVLEEISTPEGDDEAFLYTGPDDLKTRPFCEAHVGKVYTRKAIRQMDNATPTLADVFRYGGGYNCRHVWMHVPQGSALADLADTEQDVAAATIRRAA